ncbi:hypothetical protein DFQ26_009686 [Actinomortierella ambigua]|nr:hypothetical protein DFQ26_009686 [Actinomortierella ambigua]
MSFRGGHRGGKARGGGGGGGGGGPGGMGFMGHGMPPPGMGDMGQQSGFGGFQQRGGFSAQQPPPQQQQQQGPMQSQQQQPPIMAPPQQQQHGLQPLQIQPPNQPGPIPLGSSRSFMSSGMPSPSLVQSNSMPLMGGGGSGGGGYMGQQPMTGPNGTRHPFGPPIGPSTDGSKSHHDILRKHNEEYNLKQAMTMALNQANTTTPGTYVGMPSKHNNNVIPVLPRIPASQK